MNGSDLFKFWVVTTVAEADGPRGHIGRPEHPKPAWGKSTELRVPNRPAPGPGQRLHGDNYDRLPIPLWTSDSESEPGGSLPGLPFGTVLGTMART